MSRIKTYQGKVIRSNGESITDRQERVQGFEQEKYSKATIGFIGGGGLSSEVCVGGCRKGIGNLWIADHDTVELTNLNRQKFYRKDIGKNKAYRLARNLKKECIKNTIITAYPMTFQRALEEGHEMKCDVAYVGVDNDMARTAAAEYFWRRDIPVVFSAVNREADMGYVAVQEPDKACFGCFMPKSYGNERTPCPNAGAVKDILKVVGGYAL